MISDRYAKAVAFATAAHAGQLRTGTTIPYIYHPISVSALALRFGGDEDQAIGGLLHDTVEDCGVSLLTLRDRFGLRVAMIVEGCTDGAPDEHGRRAPWLERKENYIRHLDEASADVLFVSACDKLHNARSIVGDLRSVGASVFDRFDATRDQTIWYYRSLTDVFARRVARSDLVRALEHEVRSMMDFGVSGDAASL